DDVERSLLGLLVIPERLASDRQTFQLLGRAEHMDVTKAFGLEATERLAQSADLIADGVLAERAIRASCVAVATEPLGHVEHERHGRAVILTSKRDEGLSCLGFKVRCVYDRELARAEPLARNELQSLECILRGGLII